jgi:hypothetical protein
MSDTLVINGKTYVESPSFIGKRVSFKNDNKLIKDVFIVYDTMYDHFGVELFRLHNLQTGQKNQVGLPHTMEVLNAL